MNPTIRSKVADAFIQLGPTDSITDREIYFGPGKTVHVTLFTDKGKTYVSKFSFTDFRLEDSAKIYTEEEMFAEIELAYEDLVCERILLGPEVKV